jgi:uncharacterized protein (DUF2235 family)
VKSRKDYIQDSLELSESCQNENAAVNTIRSISSITNVSGTKRQRVVTPAASKVIDDEDEPRKSPSVRITSRSALQEIREGERKVLGGIENV